MSNLNSERAKISVGDKVSLILENGCTDAVEYVVIKVDKTYTIQSVEEHAQTIQVKEQQLTKL
jgi:hypothetical protein